MAVAQNAPHIPRIPNMDPNYERPRSGITRGVQITQMDEARINPQPVSLEESDYLLEQYLSPSKLNNDSASPLGPHAEMLSEDKMALRNRRRRRRRNRRAAIPRKLVDRGNPLEFMTDDELFTRFRFRGDTIIFIVGLLVHNLQRSSLPALTQVLVTLRFLATGSFYSLIADSYTGISTTSVFRSVRDVCASLSTRIREFVKMPTGADADKTKKQFYKIAGFPNVLGCVDGTLIKIMAPSENEADYISRKGFHSLNIQRLLAGVDDLEEVTSLEMKVDTTETSLGNFGALLPNLKQLKLSDSIINGIRDIGSSLRSLRVLWLCRCGLKELDGVATLTSLKELYLSYNEISDISPISMIDTLEILDLEGNYIDDVSQIQYLALCQSLKSLSLEGNPVCLLPHPNSQETDYNYRQHVRKVLPNLKILDEEPLGDGSATKRKPNVFEDDWAYLEELQKDALLLETLVDTVNIGTDSGSRPGTAALRPATAYRPGTALRRPATSFRPSSGRLNSASSRPSTTARPGTTARPTTGAVRPDSSDSSEVDATSDLTLGNVICGLPSRALKNRRKGRKSEEEMEKNKQRIMAESGRRVLSADSPQVPLAPGDSERDPAFDAEMREWRKHHDKRMEELEKERAPQVLVVDHNMSDSSLTDEDEDEDLDGLGGRGHSFLSIQAGRDSSASEKSQNHEHFKAPIVGMKHDESFEAEEEVEPVRSHRRSPSPSLRLQSLRSQSPIPSVLMANGRQLPTPPTSGRLSTRMSETSVMATATGLPAPVIRTASNPDGSPSPPQSAGSKARGMIPPQQRIRRQLPEVPSLPSRPPVPKS